MNNNVKAREYWNKMIGEDYEKVNFNKEYNGNKRENNQVELKLAPEKSEYLLKICKNDDMLIHMFILTVLKVVLTKYLQSTKLVIGIPQYIKKSDVESNNPFIVLNNKMNIEDSFKEVINNTKKQMLEAYVYQFFDINELYTSKNFYQKVNIYYCMKNIHSKSQIDNILSLNENELTLVLDKNNNEIELTFHYWDQSLSTDVKIIGNIFENVLDTILKNISIQVKDIEIVSNDEKQKLLVEFNDTKITYSENKTIPQLFEEQVEKTPNHIAIAYVGEKLTYKELNEKANAFARVLKEKGVGPEVIVAVMVNRSIEMVIGMMAVLKAGGAYLPIDPKYPQNRIEYMLKNSGVKILLTQSSLINLCKFGCEVIDLNNEKLYQGDNSNFHEITNNTNLAYVIFTSGTTGNPKGVAIEHKGIINLTNTFKKDFGINSNLKILQFASISFDAFAWELYMAVLFGAELHITTEEIIMNPIKLSQYIKDHEINILTVPPFVANELDFEDSKVELIITAGSDAKRNMVSKLSKKSRYINAYGPTECTICATMWKSESEECNTIPIGKPIRNTRVYIVDKEHHLLPTGVAGELCISGDGIARGYLANQALTDQKFVNNPFELGKKMYKTGDLARWLPDGNIEFLGRIDHQVKIRGFRIELPEIENRLLEIEGVKEVIVLDKGDSESKYVCAYYVSEKTYKVNELREELKKYLPDYMIPSYFIKLSEMPLTTNGKIDRKALPGPNSEINTGAIYEEPRNEIENVLVKVWEQVLGVNRISISDNYFSLGGNSLNAIKIASILQEENITITLSDIFMYQDIKSICNNYVAQHNDNDQSNDSNDSDMTDECNSEAFIQGYIDLTRNKVNTEYHEFTKKIINRNVMNKYKLAEIQKMSQKIGLTKSGTKVEFNFEVDIQRLESAVSSLINREEMLRAAIVEKQSEMYLYEYDTIENVKLPYLDLSKIEKDKRAFVLKEVIKDINIKVHENSNYTKNKIYYAFILVKNASNRFVLYLMVNHLIFDGMSSEIVKNLIYKEYMNDGSNRLQRDSKATYLDYINQIKKGPQEIMEEDIIKEFNLNEFEEVSKIYNEKLTEIKHKLVFKQLEFDVPHEILNNQDQMWEFAFGKFIEIYRKNLDIVNLPVSILNMGRRFGEKNYFTVIGEFLDIVPYTCTKGDSNLGNISSIMKLAGEKNINFLTIMKDEELSKKYKKVGRILNQSKIMDFDVPIFNYLGVYNADYKIAQLFQLSDDTKHTKEVKTQRGANCYVSENKLIMFIDILEDIPGNKVLVTI
ncbi:amino acid adenylation domain-containing protein [Solibacillus sp. MA9]|uniref:Amino acid adenylation domain-containing protein n=1 Tax=Solibacillus palustris TaxID=2908203 RepID=A0ABS9UDV1_9BACL|nr:amino acid adenylation domain-containing protein [Solibacillus sp. MA9]MCH7322499.1 amino acid adenylation domain-containing protein [Solibacillus sp. MA9]